MSISLYSLLCVFVFAALIVLCIGIMHDGRILFELRMQDKYNIQIIYSFLLMACVMGAAICIYVLGSFVGIGFTFFMTCFAFGISGLYVFAV